MADILPCNYNLCTWENPHAAKGSFRPAKPLKLYQVGKSLTEIRKNPAGWIGEKVWAVRIIVGLNVGKTPTYSIGHVVELVRRIRVGQNSFPDASFLIGKGMYSSETTGTVKEDAVQVIILNVPPASETESSRQFLKNMLDLAEELRSSMQQEEVIAEFQHGGIPVFTTGIVGDQPIEELHEYITAEKIMEAAQ